jgi:branched-chain amino acid transport system ATP-binding protein
MIECVGIRQSFQGLEVLKGVDLRVSAGEVVGLIGPNGAGKSTLFNAITGVHTPISGRIRLEGSEVRISSPDQAARLGIARTFQTPRPLSSLTVLENLLVATTDRAWALQCLEDAGLSPAASRPSGELNLMDRKRLEIARALALRPRILLLDEALAGLTPGEIEEALKLIRSLKSRGLAVIWVEHIVSAVFRTCDRIAVLVQGTLLCEGPPAEVAANPAVKRAYLGDES